MIGLFTPRACGPRCGKQNKPAMHKTMIHNTGEGAVLGIMAGMTTFFLKLDSAFALRLAESMIAALATGAAGALGHYLLYRIVNRKKKQQ